MPHLTRAYDMGYYAPYRLYKADIPYRGYKNRHMTWDRAVWAPTVAEGVNRFTTTGAKVY